MFHKNQTHMNKKESSINVKINHFDIIEFISRLSSDIEFPLGIHFDAKELKEDDGKPFTIKDFFAYIDKSRRFYSNVHSLWFNVKIDINNSITIELYKQELHQKSIAYKTYEGIIELIKPIYDITPRTFEFSHFDDTYVLHIFFDKLQISLDKHSERYDIKIPSNLYDFLYDKNLSIAYRLVNPINDSVIILKNEFIIKLMNIQNDMIRTRQLLKTIISPNTMLAGKKIIAIHGLKGTGKDTITSLIKYHLSKYRNDSLLYLSDAIENIGNDSFCSDLVHVERFAKPIKSFISSILGFDESYLNSPDAKEIKLDHEIWYTPIETIFDVRHLHLIVGDSIKSTFNSDIFAKTCLTRCYNASEDIVIIPDLRFRNELDVLKSSPDVYFVGVTRPGNESAEHESEHGLPFDEFDYQIRNDGSIEELNIKVIDMLVDCGLCDHTYAKEAKK